jgi:hypothetical protein
VTIRKGEQWGTLGPVPSGVVTVDDDAALHRLVQDVRSGGGELPPIGLRGGDLFRALGGVDGTDRLASPDDVALLPCDLVRLTLDGGAPVWMAVHAVVRSTFLGSAALGWWRGPIVALMNAQFLGRWDVAPRSHPNDGRVDVVSVDPSFGFGDRWKARSRLPLGTHLPHPAITTRQMTTQQWDLGTATRLWVDGIDLGRVRVLTADVEPDAYTVVV